MTRLLPPERFREFHQSFQGDTWDVCGRCGGKCEINKIGSLMPGEAEFIAAARGESVEHFREHYLDAIETPHGRVEVLKLKPGCPFLSADFKCTIVDVKVVLCEVYPIVFEVADDEEGGAKVEFSLDPWCPIVRHVPELAARFERLGIPALERLDAPVEWYRAVASFDWLCVDYQKIFARRASTPGYAVLSLDDIRECLDDEAPPPELASPSVRLPIARQ